jgi:hypothetical protein
MSITSRMGLDDGVWIATALLHREHPARTDFSNKEIERRYEQEGFADERKSYGMSISFDAVANKPANPGRTRMLFETARGRRRLYRPGDAYDVSREGPPDQRGLRFVPFREDIPEQYRYLLDWYRDEYARPVDEDPILAMVGIGRGLWSDEHPDDYVRRLREDWG